MKQFSHQHGCPNNEKLASILKRSGINHATSNQPVRPFMRTFIAFGILLLSGSPLMAQITGTTSVCVGNSTTLSDPNSGGTWSSGDATIASVDPGTGVVTGVAGGVTTITYAYLSTIDVSTVTVDAAAPTAGTISGANAVCITSATTLSTSGTTGGTWSAANTIASVAGLGSGNASVTGNAIGSDVISYSVSNSCGSSSTNTTITINGQVGFIYTYAGTGTDAFGGDNGPAYQANIGNPRDIFVDTATGTLFFCDPMNNRVRKVTRSGIITTVVGSSGTPDNGGDGGQATAATLNAANGIFVDAAGNMFISNTGSKRIRKVNASGIISTIAGTGATGSTGDGGSALSATFNFPLGILEDQSGNIYIGDQGNNNVRRIDVSGNITTIAGSSAGTAGFSGDGGQATAALLSGVRGLAMDNSGNMYIADAGNNRLRKYVPATGIITTIAGTGAATHTGDGGQATAATLSAPSRFAYDGANIIYISDQSNSSIRAISLVTGIITSVAGTAVAGFSGDGGQATAAQINTPAGIAVDHFGNFFIADALNNRVRMVPSNGSISTNIAGPSTVDAGSGVTLTSFLSASGTPVYQWLKNGVAIGGNSATLTDPSPSNGDVYNVIVTVTPPCGGTPFSDTSNNITVTVNPTITSSAGANGAIVPSGFLSVPGGNEAYTITPNAGYHVSDVLVDGVSVGAVTSYTFTSASPVAHTISASYAPDCTAPTISTAITFTNVSCNGGSNGSVTTSVAGSGVTYLWSNSATTANLTGVPAGTYTYTATNTCGSVSESATVTEPSAVVATATITQASCNGGAASVVVTATGGAGGYTGTGTFSLADGTSSTYTVSDASSCSATSSSVTASSPSAISVSGTTTDASCHGSSDGSISTSVSGGTSGYTFSWSNSATTSGISGLTAATYSVTVTDANSCTATGSFTVNQPAAITLVATSGANGTLSPSGTTTVCAGASQVYTIAPAAGYTIYDVQVDGSSVGSVTSYTFTSVSASHTIVAFFLSDTCDISVKSNFNGTSVAAGKKIWFNSVLKINGSHTYPMTIQFVNQTITSSAFSLSIPDGELILDASVTTATTTFDGTKWITTAPPGEPGNYFISGYSDSLTAALAGGLNPVTWTATVIGSTSDVALNWQWAAAAYTSFNSDPGSIGVKPSDCNSCSSYSNSDHAGTPEHYKSYVIGGTRGGGGSNYTGSYSGTGTVKTCSSAGHKSGSNGQQQTVAGANEIKVYPNPNEGTFNVVIPAEQKTAEIFITDITGRTLQTRSVTENSGTPVEFNMDHAMSGIYLVKVNAGNYSTVVKLVVR